ncbi:hypothetical protein [Poseidonocella pacifica]|uniref:hypothetical protein n=1 Tax=Poseidonocella pacifica TaxID=871651 RepID=UPI001113D90D|nr:hypothetical protein [Poseidonocella pacifica]
MSTDLACDTMVEFLAAKVIHSSYGARLDEFETALGPATVIHFEAAVRSGLLLGFMQAIGFGHIPLQEPEPTRESVSLRAALWLMRTKMAAKTPLGKRELWRRWYFCLSSGAEILQDRDGESLWVSDQQRDAFFDRALHGFRYASLWEKPTSAMQPLEWSAEQQGSAEAQYLAWVRSNAAWIRLREKRKLAPYVSDAAIQPGDRYLRYPFMKIAEICSGRR